MQPIDLPPAALATPPPNSAWRSAILLSSALVIAIYGWITFVMVWEPLAGSAGLQTSNLQAAAFRAGQLHLPVPVPPGFAELKNPYDPKANQDYRIPSPTSPHLHDLSYYRGKFFVYFGVTPVLTLFQPWHFLTGTPFPQEIAVTVFCTLGFVAGVWLLQKIAAAYFPRAGAISLAATILAFGLCAGQPVLLWRPEIYEVTISCGFAFAMISLAAAWVALERERHRCLFLAAASLAYGLALVSRPSLLFGAAFLWVPFFARVRADGTFALRRHGKLFLAAALPITLVGVGQLAFNHARFESIFEFGQKYQLADVPVHAASRVFSGEFIAANLRMYLVEPLGWTRHSIFPLGTEHGTLPGGYLGLENTFGILSTLPVVWLALGSLLVFTRSIPRASSPGWFVFGLWMMGLINLTTLCCFAGAAGRYEADFLPPLLVLAGIGGLAVERTLTNSVKARYCFRIGWIAAFSYSLLAGALVGASAQSPYIGFKDRQMQAMLDLGYTQKALAWYERSARIYPTDGAAHYKLGMVYLDLRSYAAAYANMDHALRLNPAYGEIHNKLGTIRAAQQRFAEARVHFLKMLELEPQHPTARDNLAILARHEREFLQSKTVP